MASEISPSQKDRSCVAPLRGGPESRPVPRDGQERGVARGRGGEKGKSVLRGCRVPVLVALLLNTVAMRSATEPASNIWFRPSFRSVFAFPRKRSPLTGGGRDTLEEGLRGVLFFVLAPPGLAE